MRAAAVSRATLPLHKSPVELNEHLPARVQHGCRTVDKVVIGLNTVAEVDEAVELVEAANTVPLALWREAQSMGLLPAALQLPGE